jgi:hypothetical protein
MRFAQTLRRLLPGVWLGLLLCVALVATPAPFATLSPDDAGRVVRRIFTIEAPTSLVLGVLLLLVERRAGLARHAETGASQFTGEMMLVLGALFCTVAGHYGLQPLFEQARAGAGSIGFGQLHLASTAFFGLKILLVFALGVEGRAVSAPEAGLVRLRGLQRSAFFLTLGDALFARFTVPPAVTRSLPSTVTFLICGR